MEAKPLSSSKIAQRFIKLKAEKRIALMPFLMAGDPDIKTSRDVLLRLEDKGADIIELGIPYSDPLADGPVIQAAAARSLSSGTTPSSVLEMLSGLKGQLSVPVILFTYANPLINKGMENFCFQAAEAGAAGLVVPDLPLEEAELLSPIATDHGLDLVLLVAPTTPKERMRRIAESSKGFVYLVSVTGVTGERTHLEDRVETLVRQLKDISSVPVAVGFGISGPDQIRQVKSWGADGAIVGSALVKKIANSMNANQVDEAGIFCKELLEATLN